MKVLYEPVQLLLTQDHQVFFSTICCQIIELHQFCNDRFFLPIADPFGNTGLQVLFQDQCFKLLNGLAHCIRLAQNVNAVLVLFDHLANTTNVSLDVVEPLQYILLVSAHLSSPLVSPLPAGYGIVYHKSGTPASILASLSLSRESYTNLRSKQEL